MNCSGCGKEVQEIFCTNLLGENESKGFFEVDCAAEKRGLGIAKRAWKRHHCNRGVLQAEVVRE